MNTNIPERFRKGYDEPARVVISHPGSGRTWITNMLRELNVVTEWSHAGSGWGEEQAYLPQWMSRLEGGNCIFLTREPKDTIVSSFFFAKSNAGIDTPDGMTLHEYVRHSRYGMLPLLKHRKFWIGSN